MMNYFEGVLFFLKKWFNGCGRTSAADPAHGRSFSSRGYRVAVGQCGSRKFGPSIARGRGSWPRVGSGYCWKMGASGPTERKVIRSQERWGRVSWIGTVFSSHSQSVLDLSFPRSASKRSRARSQVGTTNGREAARDRMKYYCVSVRAVSRRTQ